MSHKLELVKVLPYVVALTLGAASVAFAQSSNSLLSPNNPNCSPGVQGCTANYATTDHSDDVPQRSANFPKTSEMSPNCSPGQQGCTANYATTDHSDDVPQRPANHPPQQ